MLDVIPCTNCEANEVRAEVDAIEALCENCEGEGWHGFNHSQCHHPWYSQPVERNQRSEDIQYKLERQWLLSLPADTITQCLNGEPVTAEDRLFTVEDILTNWYGITLGYQVKRGRR